MPNKLYPSASAAVQDVPDGAVIHFGGFGGVGVPIGLIHALCERGVGSLTGVSNHCGDGEEGLAALIKGGQVAKMITSFPSHKGSYHFLRRYEAGQIDLEMVPQGTLAERIRAAGAGIPGFYTRTGVGTVLEAGKEKRLLGGQEYLFESALPADYALIRAAKCDTYGNCRFRRTARTFNPDMAMAARCTIVEAEEIVAPGEIDPDDVHLPGIFVNRVVRCELTQKSPPRLVAMADLLQEASEAGPGLTRAQMAARIAQEFRDGDAVNLGIGMPTLVSAFVRAGTTVFFHSENGALGVGEFAGADAADSDMINASRQAVRLIPGAATFRHSDSFAMIRGGHIDVTVLGAYQVSERGDLANWLLPGQKLGGIGGAMDLAAGARRVLAMMDHTSKGGEPKLRNECTYTLTAPRCVHRIFTNLAVIDVTPEGLVLREIASGISVAAVQALTEPTLIVAGDLRTIRV